MFNWEIWIRICNKKQDLKTDSNADSVAATRRGDQSLLLYRSDDKLLQPVARHVAGTDRFVCSGEFLGNLCLSNRILSLQKLHKFSLIWFCPTSYGDKILLRRQRFSQKFSTTEICGCRVSLQRVAANCCLVCSNLKWQDVRQRWYNRANICSPRTKGDV